MDDRRFDALTRALAQLNVNLRSIVRDARNEVENMAHATQEIASGNQDLSSRTESQAANLQQTAASMEEITSTVRSSAGAAQTAAELAARAREVTASGSSAIGEVNRRKAEKLYRYLDGSGFYRNPIDPACRSWMNVPMILADAKLDGAFLKGGDREGAVGMGEMVRDRHHLFGSRMEVGVALGVRPLIFRQEAGHVLIQQPVFHLGDRQNVAVADHKIDVVQRDAFRVEAVVDDVFIKTAGMFLAGDPFLGDRIGDFAIPQQARAHVMVVSIEAEDVCMFFGHGPTFGAAGLNAL